MSSIFPYEDIIGLERPVSKTHLPMTMEQRAAQFAPFSALDGLDDALAASIPDQQSE